MGAVSSAGVGSGLQLEQLITDLINAEATPKSAELDRKEANITAQLSAYGTLKSAVSELRTSVFNLSLTSTYTVNSASSENSSVFTATADASATAGSYAVEVVQLASANRVGSSSFTGASSTVGTGNMTITVGGNSFNVTIDSTNNTLSGIKSAIAAADTNNLVTATIVTVDAGTQLILTSNATGLSNTIGITVNDDDGNNSDTNGLSQLATANLVQLTPARDASIRIDTQTVTSSSNVFTNAIEGVTITANQLSDGGASSALTIGRDTSNVRTQISTLVDTYNRFITVTNELTAYDSQAQVAATLQGDALTRGLLSQVRNVLGVAVTSNTGSLLRSSDLGFVTERDGSITLEPALLDNMLKNRFNDVQTLLAGSNGIAGRLDSALASYNQQNGIIDTKTQTLSEQDLSRIQDERIDLSLRINKLEERLRDQFVALDRLVANLRAQGSFLSQQLASLPGFGQPNGSKDG